MEVLKKRVSGAGYSLAEAFEQAALSMSALVAGPVMNEAVQTSTIACCAGDADQLLCDWLDALIGKMDGGGLVLGRFAVEINGVDLFGLAWGEPRDRRRQQPRFRVMRIAPASAQVRRTSDGRWFAQCLVEIAGQAEVAPP